VFKSHGVALEVDHARSIDGHGERAHHPDNLQYTNRKKSSDSRPRFSVDGQIAYINSMVDTLILGGDAIDLAVIAQLLKQLKAIW